MATAGRLYTGGKGRVGVYEATYIMAAHVHTIRTTKPNGTTFFFRSFFIFPARPGDDTGWDVFERVESPRNRTQRFFASTP